MKREKLVSGEYYHIFNRGVEKRSIFKDRKDMERFLKCIVEFNRREPIGSLYENYFYEKKFGNRVSKKLTDIVCYCLNPNHYHFILKQSTDQGISKFMHKVMLGYTKYFNQKYDRVGPLFQGPYRLVHIKSNEQLLHAGVYINLNFKVHGARDNFFRSSWSEYIHENNPKELCEKGIILKQFKNPVEYKKFAEYTLPSIKDKKEMAKIVLE
jgi:REP element-mobilizing transposase RayT